MDKLNETNSLALLAGASKMLAEANTIQKAKELKDLALTAADWARRKGLGEEAVQYARSYALDAERRMGELLLETDRAKGGNPNLPTSNGMLPVEPTLAELGLTKRDSVDAQKLASLPKQTVQASLAACAEANCKACSRCRRWLFHSQDARINHGSYLKN